MGNSRSFVPVVLGVIGALLLTGYSPRADAARRDVQILHTYETTDAWEVTSAIAVSADKLTPLLPPGYVMVPASAIGFGNPDQGIVILVNFQGLRPSIDQRSSLDADQVVIDIGILIAEPAEAALVNANLPGAFHFYALAIYTDNPRYAASLQGSGMPVEFVREISYDRQFDDAAGSGTLKVNVPNRDGPFHSMNSGISYLLMNGALNGVFWHTDRRGTSALHFQDQPFLQGQAFSQLYLLPHTSWGRLLLGGGFGPCPAEPATGYQCVTAPSLNFRYPQGTHGRLSLIRD
jgi:hypothetical protein